MSRTIDERVVSMQFDNRQFESNVRTSLSTIERLKQSLNFKSASDGLSNVTKAAKSCNLAPLSSAAETVRMKFSAMEVMAVTALANITNSAINTGKKVVSALTIDPIKTGLSEYETQIGAIQTILANTESKGTTLGDVNAALDELNTYADKTIYNFTQMTRNIGTFTAAGVGLDESTQAIKGIANLAAVSGSTSQQASTAMYQLSQALAAGRVSLMDWNSVVNAGMGGEVFQNALKRTSRMLGTGVDEAIKKYGTFRESLTQGQWLTKEVLVETLAQLSGAYTEADLIAQGFTQEQAAEITKLAQTAEDAATKVKTFTQLWDTLKESAQSGWTQTWEYILGDFEESKWFFSNLSDTIGAFIGKGSESRNNLLGEALGSNYDKLISKLKEAGIEASDFEAKVKETLTKNGANVDHLIQKYGSLGRAITHGAVPAGTLKRALYDLGQAANISLEGIDRVLKRGSKGEDVKIAQKALKALGHDLGTFGEKADGVDGIIGSVTESAIKAFQAAHNLEATGIIDEKTLAALEKAANASKILGEELYKLVDDVDKLGGGELLRESITNVVTGVLNILSTVRSAWGEVFKIEPDQIYGALDVIHKVTEKFVKWTEGNSDKIKMVFQGVISVLGVAWDTLQAVFSGLWKIASPIFSAIGKGIFTAASAIGSWLVGLRDSIVESGIFAKVTNSIANAINKVINFVKRLGKPIWEWIFGSENDTEGQLSGLQQFIEKIKKFVSESKTLARVGEAFNKASKAIRDFFTNLFSTLGNGITTATKAIGDWFIGIRNFVVESGIFAKVTNSIANAINKVVTYVKNIGKPIWEWIFGSENDAEGQLTGLQQFIEKIKNFITESKALAHVGETFSKFGKKIRDYFTNLFPTKEELAQKAFNIKDVLTKVGRDIVDFFKNFSVGDIIAKIGNFFREFGAKFKSDFLSIGFDFSTMKTAIAAKFVVIKDAIVNFFKNFSVKDIIGKIGNFFKEFSAKFVSAFATIGLNLSTMKTAIAAKFVVIKDAIINFFKNFSIKDVASEIGNFFKDFGAKFSSGFATIGLNFVAIKDSIVSKFVLVKDAVVNFFKDFSFEEAYAKLKENLAKIGPIIKSCFEKIVEMFGVSKQKLEGIRENISGFFGGIFDFLGENKGAIAAFGTIVGIIAILAKIKNAISRIAGIADALDDVKGAFEGLIESKRVLNKAATTKLRTESVKNMAIAIGIIAGSLWLISKIPKDDLLRSTIVLGIITGAVIGVMFLMRFLSANVSIKSISSVMSFGTLMASLGTALLLMTIAVKMLGKMDPDELKQGGLAVAAFVGITLLIMKASKTINQGSFASFGRMMKQLGAALLLLSASVYIFGKMDRDTLIQGGLAVTYFLGVMAGIMAIAGVLQGDVRSFGSMIRNLSVSLLLLAGTVYIFGSMDTKTLIKGGLAVTTFLGIMLAAMVLSRNASKHTVSFGKMMLSIGASLLLMAGAVKILGNMDTKALLKGTIFVAGFAGIIIGLMAATKLMGKYSFNAGKMGLMILTFSASLLIMAGAVAALSMIEGKNLTKALAAIAGIGLIFSGLLAVTKFAKNTEVGTILALSGAVAVMAGAVAALAFVPKEKLISATACLSILAGMFSLLSYTSKFATGKSLLSLAGMALIIGGIGLIFVKLSDIVTDADKAVKVATAVGILVTALSISSLALSKIGGTGTNTKAIFTGLGVFAGLATIVTIFAGIAIASLPAIARKLSGFMIELEPFISGMAKIDRSMVTNIKILGEAMSAFAGAGAKFAFANAFTLGGVTMAFGEFVNFISQVVPVIKDAAIDTAGVDIDFTNLNAIIKAIGGLAEAAALVPTNTIAFAAGKWGVGAFINVNDLTAFTTFVTSVIPLMQEFAIAIKGADIDTSSTKVVGDLFEAIGYLAEAADKAPGVEVAAGLASFKGGMAAGGYISVPDLRAFTSYTRGVLDALKEFIPGIAGTVPDIPIEFVIGVFEGVKKLGEAAEYAPKTTEGWSLGVFGNGSGGGGVVSYAQISTDLEAFRTYLVGDGMHKGVIYAVKDFINGIKVDIFSGVDADKIEPIMTGITNVITAISELGKAADAAPKSSVGGGVGGAFSKLGKAFGIGAGGYKSTTDLIAFKDYLLGDGGAIAAVKSFIDGMTPIAGQLDDYKPEKITAITDGISNVISAISALAAAASSAPTNIDAHGIGGFGGFLKGFVGGFGKADLVTTTDLDSFKSWLIGSDGKSGMMGALTGFIDIFEDKATLNAIKKIADNTKGIDTVISAVTSLAGLANSAPKQIDAKGGFGGIFSKLVGGLGIGAGGGYGEYHSVTDLKNFKDWITEVTPVIKGFVVDVSGVEIPDTSALETVLTAVDTIATAASNIQPKTEGWAAGLAVISGIPVLAGGSGGSAADYQGFISLMENLGSSDGPLATLITTVNGLTFDGSVDSAASQKLTCLLQAVDALATASANIPEYTVFESGLAIIAGYKKAPDFTGFTNWINGMTGTDGKGGIVKLIADANTNLPGEGELDPAKITNLCYVVKELADAASVLPDTSVWGELFSGTTNFDGFATFVETIGSEVTTFAETIANSTIEDIDLSKILSMADVLKTIAEVGNLLGSGGYVDVSVLGLEDGDGKSPIDYIVDAVVSAKEALGKLEESDLAALEVAGNTITAFSQTLTNVAGNYASLAQYTPENNEQFKTFVTDLATSLSDFTANMEGVNLDRLSIASNAVSLIAGTLTKLAALEYGSINTALLKQKLDELATAMNDFTTNFNADSISTSISTVSSLATDLSTALSKDFSGAEKFKSALDTLGSANTDLSGLSGLGDKLSSTASSSVDAFVSAFSSSSSRLSTVGTGMMQQLVSGISSGAKSVASAAKAIADAAALAVSGKYSAFYNAGGSVAQGFANGISANAFLATAKARAMADAAYQAAKQALNVNSPSKLFRSLGYTVPEGFAIGIDRMGGLVKESSKAMADTAFEGTKSTIARLAESINTDIDAQPTIRPVLDLSDVQSGASQIGTMFGTNPSIGVLSRVGTINSMMNARVQNGANSDVISAINDLGKKLGSNGGDTYNVNGVTYDDGSNITDAVKTLIRAAKVERRI